MSCGHDAEALAALAAAEGLLGRLPEAHAAEPLLHGARGHLLYHTGQLQAAFEQLVQVRAGVGGGGGGDAGPVAAMVVLCLSGS
jgi:hypothetical protein